MRTAPVPKRRIRKRPDQTTVTLPLPLRQRLSLLAETAGVPMAQLIREAIEEYLVALENVR